jgi:hypothetical protein
MTARDVVSVRRSLPLEFVIDEFAPWTEPSNYFSTRRSEIFMAKLVSPMLKNAAEMSASK